MNSSTLLKRAAAGVCCAESYDPKSTVLAQLAVKQPYNATLALERASCRLKSGAALCSRGDQDVLADAKARVCKVVGYPHLDLWEWYDKPTWVEVRKAFQEAA